ncbi:54S ribosomal protein L4 mitochondrial [Friedmanniomyces endolithicus]|uniref:Large ribosomal subunit protein uL29m n=2 Tax=Friedmanniomyces endolithicus TaxID=329885 RepID=A0A4U0U0T2_9PEZI|nr:54S ribosomal protein L4 mitochondrial [Friedmanniomyces endolithicus]KAK0302868.1 54S ribosomal protein L4 mitochondrial [Friedmanniomyces endolithicus]KAK0325537.1 54S ribosomal protein L4 mitochondrial [Friedmanniomyces endolithicus]KAK0829713.1 54S ribosomal protein L4 mitochondrial [Friedmanniomyces endolithicus]KAK0911493.1 54S ribosomal protein L4 mitochondrial [Friedmanniomyces endolithicus]
MPPCKMHCTSASLLRSTILSSSTCVSTLPPPFLLPAFAQTASFCSTPIHHARKDHNRNRGVSALRHTGIGKNQRLSVRVSALPQPVLDPARRSAVEVDPDHGLWGFFSKERTLISTPEEMNGYGRSWTIQELRGKDWDDLHKLWWTCVKEQNRIATGELERKRLAGDDGMYGDYEAAGRAREVRGTMWATRFVLTERWYSYENARVDGMDDEEVDLYADLERGERAYLPRDEAEETLLPGGEGGESTEGTVSYVPPDVTRSPGEARV